MTTRLKNFGLNALRFVPAIAGVLGCITTLSILRPLLGLSLASLPCFAVTLALVFGGNTMVERIYAKAARGA